MGPDYTPLPEQTQAARISALWQAVFGVTGNNGMRGDSKECRSKRESAEKDMRKRIGRLEVGQARLAVIAGVGSGLVVTLGSYLLKMIGG